MEIFREETKLKNDPGTIISMVMTCKLTGEILKRVQYKQVSMTLEEYRKLVEDRSHEKVDFLYQ